MLGVITNGNRAMIMAMDEPGDPGQHAVDPGAEGEEGGYRLGNGQVDRYDNSETVPLHVALDVVRELIDHGRRPATVAWHDDRG
ncbi:Imm1 family immunity protein [Micromonospora violae]|uniref:Imm1 family immunity protein n=1 Tax=Micromonospora violae TaxID=1278207 RepID=UPI0033F97615